MGLMDDDGGAYNMGPDLLLGLSRCVGKYGRAFWIFAFFFFWFNFFNACLGDCRDVSIPVPVLESFWARGSTCSSHLIN